MDLFTNGNNQTLLPGQRLLKIKGGYEAAEKYPMPRDCEVCIFDEEEAYFYVKKTDTNGGVTIVRCKYEEDPIPHFDPAKYVTVDDLAKFKEEILNGFNNLQQTLAPTGSAANGGRSNKPNSKSNSGFSQSSGNIQPTGE